MSSYLIFTNQKTKKRLVFYPVPKNANTSTKLFFAKHLGIDKDYVFLSDDKPEYQFRDNMYEILNQLFRLWFNLSMSGTYSRNRYFHVG